MALGLWGPDDFEYSNGLPVVGKPYSVFLPGTTTLASLFTDVTGATSAPNPGNTGSGNVSFFVEPGFYDILLLGTTFRVVVSLNPADGGGGGGGAPTGAAGGDLSGAYPNPTVPGLASKATTVALAAETAARTAADAAHVVAVDPHGDRAAATAALGVLDASLAPVAKTGVYVDLTGKPTIPTTAAEVGADPTGSAAAAQAFAVQRANHTGTQAQSTVIDLVADLAAKETPAGAQAKADIAQAYAIARTNHTGTQTADTITDGTTNKAFLATERTKLAGIATGATANATDAALRDRSTHTGVQDQSTISNLAADLLLKADLVSGIVPSSQLPGYVDAILEYADLASFPATGEAGKLYVAADTNLVYRWTGTTYVSTSSALALGENSSSAYRGDRGKIAYDHSQLVAGNPHLVTKAEVGLGSVDDTADTAKPVSTAQQTALNLKLNTSSIGVTVQAWAAVLDATTASFTTAKDSKLAGIADGATVNSTDAQLRDRATHTGNGSVIPLGSDPPFPVVGQVYYNTTTSRFRVWSGTAWQDHDLAGTAAYFGGLAVIRSNHTGTQSADTLTDGTTNKAFLATERTKLTGIATGATQNSTDATLLNRLNHTGTQAQSTITNLVSDLTNKANLVTGKVPTAELATGTASGSTVLFGNQTWGALPGGGDMNASTYDPAGRAEQVVTIRERIHIKDFGAVGNGIADDTAAFNSAIAYLGATSTGNGAGTIVLGEGTFRITSTVIILGKAVIFEGAGVGNPSDYGTDYTTKSRGSTIVWDGVSTTTPLFAVRDSWFCQFKDILITARPSRKATSAIYFENFGVNSRGTNAKHSVVRCRIGASAWEIGHLENVRFDYGVRIGGINGNNDEWMIEGCVFTNYGIAGTWVETSQSVWGHISDTLYEGLNNGPAGRNYPALMGVKVDADVQMSNVQFNRNSVNVQVSAGQATIFGMYAEQFRQAVLLTGSGSKLNLYGGRLYHNIEEWETAGGGKAVIEHQQCGGGAMVNLQGVSMNANGSVTLPRKINVRGNTSSVRGDVLIVGCSDLDLTSLDIAGAGTGTGANQGLYVHVDSFGKKVRKRLTGNTALSTTAEDNFSTYGLVPNTNRVDTTGTDVKAFVSGVETASLFLATERAKLTGMATGATVNSTDAQLRDRATHTGNGSIVSSATDPTSPVVGQIYWNTVSPNFRIWTGTVWQAYDNAGTAAFFAAGAVQRANHTGVQAQSTVTNLVSDLAAKANKIGDLGVEVAISTPSTSWSVGHSLTFRPNVTLLNSAGDEFTADQINHSPGLVTATLLAATAGTMFLS